LEIISHGHCSTRRVYNNTYLLCINTTRALGEACVIKTSGNCGGDRRASIVEKTPLLGGRADIKHILIPYSNNNIIYCKDPDNDRVC